MENLHQVDLKSLLQEWNAIDIGPGTILNDENAKQNEKTKIVTCRTIYMPFLVKLLYYICESKICNNDYIRNVLTIALNDLNISYNPNYISNLIVFRDGIKNYIHNNDPDIANYWYVHYTIKTLMSHVNNSDQLALDIFSDLNSFCNHMNTIINAFESDIENFYN